MDYLELELEVSAPVPGQYAVAVVASPGGQAREPLHLPYDDLGLASHLKDVQIALLRSGTRVRRILDEDEATVQSFGSDMLEALLPGGVRSCYDVSLQLAKQQRRRLRVRLRILPAELAKLPWEFLYDSREGEFLGLSRDVSLVRFLELPGRTEPLQVRPPLRVLCMIASPTDLPELDVSRERERLDEALGPLRASGLLEVVWLEGQTWRRLQAATMQGPWHVFHFIGHGDFDRRREEGLIALVDDVSGRAQLLTATQLARLLAGNDVRIAVLNSCEGAHAAESDVFSSTAATLVRRGIPAVLAMQYAISDQAALEFSRTFYQALAVGMPVDASVSEARIAMSLASTVEWATPVLHMRSPDGRLFDLVEATAPARTPPSPSEETDDAEPVAEERVRPVEEPRHADEDQAPQRRQRPARLEDEEHAGRAGGGPRLRTPSPTRRGAGRMGGWLSEHRMAIAAGTAAFVLAAGIGTLAVVRLAPGPVPRPERTTATSTAPPSAPSAPAYAMDVKNLSNIDVLGPTSGLNSARITSGGGYLELAFSRQSGNRFNYALPPMSDYREELELSVNAAGSTVYVVLNQQDQTSVYWLRLDIGSETAQLFRRAPDGTQRPLGPSAPVSGLGSGQRLAMTIVVGPPAYTVSVGGQTLLEATESPTSQTPGKLGFAATGNEGSVRIYRAEVRSRNG